MNKPSVWTRFMDMYSGGRCKLSPFEYIYIESDKESAELIFEDQLHRDPYGVSCGCCGPDYSIEEYASLEDATQYDRVRCGRPKPALSLEKFMNRNDVLFLFKANDFNAGEQ